MDSQVAGTFASLVSSIEAGTVSYIFLIFGGLIGFILAVFAIKWGWGAIWVTAKGGTPAVGKYDNIPIDFNIVNNPEKWVHDYIGTDIKVVKPVDTYKVGQKGGTWWNDSQKLNRSIRKLKRRTEL